MTDEAYLALAVRYARRSSIRGYQTGALITNTGGMVSQGWSHRSEIRYSQTPFSCHAELHAINRAKQSRLIGATIYVATVRRKSGNIVSGKPCPICEDIILKVGIERVVHT